MKKTNKDMVYYETELKVEMKPESTKAFINRVTLGFDHKPHYYEVVRKLAERYPEVDLVSVENSYDATFKAKELMKFYNR